MKRVILGLFSMAVLSGLLAGCNGARDTAVNMVAQNGKVGFNVRTLPSDGRKYGVFIPLAYKPENKCPVIVFLHGVGEGGSDCRSNMRVGLAPFVADQAANFDFICIFPQSWDGHWNADSSAAKDAIASIEDVAKDYSVDRDRISLTGLSTGGYGTWAIGAAYSKTFCALVPMGTSEDPRDYAGQLVNMPIRAYHNGGDWAAGIWNDTQMCDKVNSMGGHAQFTQTDGPGHDCWEGVYADGELFQWLRQQRRHTSPSPSAMAPTPPSAMVPIMTPIVSH